MYCSDCGFKNNGEDNFCVNCGNKLNKVIKNNESNGNKETSLVLGIICLVSSFFINILCFIPGIISIVYANKYKKESGKLGVGFGLSLGGMVFSFIVMLLTIFVFFFFINFINSINNETNYDVYPEYTHNLPSV